MHEDPALVLLYSCLRSYSLQTVKGAIAVPGQTEFNVSPTFLLYRHVLKAFTQFVLHIARVLSRMGKFSINFPKILSTNRLSRLSSLSIRLGTRMEVPQSNC